MQVEGVIQIHDPTPLFEASAPNILEGLRHRLGFPE